MWEELKFTPHYLTDVERFALVGDERWQEWVTRLSDAVTAAEAEFFPADQLNEAWEWISE